MNLIRSLFASTVLMVAASPAFAQLDANLQLSNDRLHLVSSGPYSPYGLYTGRLLQSIGTPVIDMWCDDFTHHISTKTDFNVNVTRFDASASDWNNRTRFGFAKLNNYKKAAYLGSFFAGLTNHDDVEDLHYTIWRLFGNSNAGGAPRPGELNWLAVLSDGKWANINTKYWFVLSDVAITTRNGVRIGGAQEQITMVTPEPGAILLVSTGLLGIVGLAKVRRRGKKQD